MIKGLEEIKGKNTPLETNGVFEVEKEDTRKGVEDTLKIGKIIISEEEVESILKENKVIQRITLLRHYPYKEETKEYERYLYLLNKKRKGGINKEENNELKMISEEIDKKVYGEIEQIPEGKYIDKKLLDELFKNPIRILLAYYSSEKGIQRCKITGDNICLKYGIKEFKNVDLVGGDKGLDIGEIYSKTPEELRKIIDEIIEQNNNDYDDIVIISNRSYAHGFNLLRGDRYITVDESISNFENNFSDFIDYGEDNKIINNNYLLKVIFKNYNSLKKLFNIGHTSIIDFQNKLNVYLIKNPELIKRYVKSEIDELKKYCLLKLIETKELETLNEIFREKKIRKEIKLEEYEKGDKKVYNILRYYLEVYPELLTLRNKSLDERINNGEDIEPNFNFDKPEYNELLELIKKGKSIKYIEGKAGAGKSFLLSHIAEKLNEENLNNNKLPKLYYPVYVNLSGKGLDEINEIGIEIYNDYEVIYLIDSIDESKIYGEERKDLDKKLLSLSKKGKVIITSRSGYKEKYDEEKEDEKYLQELLDINREIINLNDLNEQHINRFLIKYFDGSIKEIDNVKTILSKINGAGNNGLILLMICNIVKSGRKIFLEVTISNLYEELINQRLLNWNIDKNRRDVNKKGDIDFKRLSALNKKILNLSIIAYKKLIDGKKYTLNDLEKIIDEESLDIESYNLLFENSNGEYDFIHHSFEEFFATKYILNYNFDFGDFLLNKIKNVDNNFLILLSEILNYNDKIKDIFLDLLNKNKIFFSENTILKIIFLLGELDINERNKYLLQIDLNNRNIFEYFIKNGKIGDDFYILNTYNDYNLGNVESELIEKSRNEWIILKGGEYSIDLIYNFLDNPKNLSFKTYLDCIKYIIRFNKDENLVYIKYYIKNINKYLSLIDNTGNSLEVLYGVIDYILFNGINIDLTIIRDTILKKIEYNIKYGIGYNYYNGFSDLFRKIDHLLKK